jgi:hypothetical protein
VADYDARRAPLLAGWKATHGQQAGDPAMLAQARLAVACHEPPPRRFLAAADAISTAEQTVADLQADIASRRQLSTSLAFDAWRAASGRGPAAGRRVTVGDPRRPSAAEGGRGVRRRPPPGPRRRR